MSHAMVKKRKSRCVCVNFIPRFSIFSLKLWFVPFPGEDFFLVWFRRFIIRVYSFEVWDRIIIYRCEFSAALQMERDFLGLGSKNSPITVKEETSESSRDSGYSSLFFFFFFLVLNLVG